MREPETRRLCPSEAEFFRDLNRFIEPLVRAGVGSPRTGPGTLIVLETRGRESGRVRRTPLAATRIGKHVLVGTFRGRRSHWIRNLVAQPRTRYWLGGTIRETRAFVLVDAEQSGDSLPAHLQGLVRFLSLYVAAGWGFAFLSPRGR